MLLTTRRTESRGPRISVPDTPWSRLYDPAETRAAVRVLEEGGCDREAWRAYLDAGRTDPEAVRVLRTASKVHGRKLKTRRRRAKDSG